MTRPSSASDDLQATTLALARVRETTRVAGATDKRTMKQACPHRKHKVSRRVIADENRRQGKILYAADAAVRRIESSRGISSLRLPGDSLADRLVRVETCLAVKEVAS